MSARKKRTLKRGRVIEMVGKQAKLAIALGALVFILGAGAYSRLRGAVQEARGVAPAASTTSSTTTPASSATTTAAAVPAGDGAPGVAGGQADAASRGPEAPATPAPIIINVGGAPAPAPPPPVRDYAVQGPPAGTVPQYPTAAYASEPYARGRDDPDHRSIDVGRRGTSPAPYRANTRPVPNTVQGQTFQETITPGSRGHGGFTVRETPRPTGALRVDSNRRPVETASQQRNRGIESVLAGGTPQDAVRGRRGMLSTRRDQTTGRGFSGDRRGQEVIASGDLAAIRALAAERLAQDLRDTPNLTTGTGPRREGGPQGSASSDRAERLRQEQERARGVFDSRLITRF